MIAITFKTSEINKFYQSLISKKSLTIPPKINTELISIIKIIDNSIDNEISDLDLCENLNLLSLALKNFCGLNFYDIILKICRYIVINNYTCSIDVVMQHMSNIFQSFININICTLSDSTELYKKYCYEFNIFDNICLTLLNTNYPGILTDFIINNYDYKQTIRKKINIDFYHNKQFLSISSIKYLINIYNFSINDVNLIPIFFEHYDTEDIIDIVNMLITNCDNPKMYDTIKNLIRCDNFDLLKYFIDNYSLDDYQYIKLLSVVYNLDQFLLIQKFTNMDSLEKDHFSNLVYCYDITEWLLDHGYTVRPNMEDLDFRTINLILDDAINNSEYSYIQDNLYEIYYSALYFGSDLYFQSNFVNLVFLKLVNLINLNVITYPEIVSNTIELNNLTILKILLDGGLKVENLNDIIFDLENLKQELNTDEYILVNIDNMIRILLN